jgi:uroporphyrinogen-III synthase
LTTRSSFETPSKQLAFYPCSSIRKDDLSNELKKANIPFEELNVYKTTVADSNLGLLKNFIDEFLVTAKSSCDNSKQRIICLVFFSPSGVEAVFKNKENDEILSKYADLPKCIYENISFFRIFSIGPSTTQRLKQILNNTDIFVDELSEPSPQALLESLLKFYNK